MINKEQIIKTLKTIKDPEVGIDVYTLELIRNIEIKTDKINIEMTFTSPMCPFGPTILKEIKTKLKELKEVKDVDIEVTFDPPWEPSEGLRSGLGV